MAYYICFDNCKYIIINAFKFKHNILFQDQKMFKLFLNKSRKSTLSEYK